MVTCTGHIGIHEGADGRTYVRTLYVRTTQRSNVCACASVGVAKRRPKWRSDLVGSS